MNDNVVSSLHITDEQVREVIDRETAELSDASRPIEAADQSPTRAERS